MGTWRIGDFLENLKVKLVSVSSAVCRSKRSSAAAERLPEGTVENCAGTDRISCILASEPLRRAGGMV